MPILNRVRGRWSGYQPEVDPHDWHLPTSYSVSRSRTSATEVPNPALLRNAFIPTTPVSSEHTLVYPDISHAAVHLCLLECFRELRRSATKLDLDSYNPPAYEEKPKNSDISDSRLPESVRWEIIIQLAVTRFATWWNNIDQVLNHAIAYTHHAGDKANLQLPRDYLPPIDVLLVWYALMLDHEAYQEACTARTESRLHSLCFPWPAIGDSIDRGAMKFELSRAAENLFATLSEQSTDILTYLDVPPAYLQSTALPFTIDLVAAVKQQEKFIDAAHELLWIRSPALQGSLERASEQYLRARSSGQLSRNGSSLPFGVNLIWRTHQLYPSQYHNFLTSSSDIFESVRHEKARASEMTSATALETVEDGVSDQCCCWRCERIRDDLPEFSYDTCNASYDVALISSLSGEQLRSIQDDLGFHCAVEKARRAGLPLPGRPPTAAEKEAEKIEYQKRKAAGRLLGLNECIEITPSGKRKIRVSKGSSVVHGLSMA